MTGSPAQLKRIVELGRGGMSRVYLSLNEGNVELPTLVVVKVLLADLARDHEFVEMFFDEATLSARLDHPNVVKIFDVHPTGDEPYMILEYLDGASLESLVRRAKDAGGMPVALHLHAIAQAAHGLHYAHELSDAAGNHLGIVHRDVSPHNVFVTFDGVVKVLDFGVAKAADSNHQTKTGVMKGKFGYMAPEQVRDSKRVDRRVDVFALGVMLWQAAMKRRPWAGLSDIEIARTLLKSGLPQAESTPENPIDAELLDVIHRATASKPGDRFATAGEFVFALDRYLAKLPEKAGPRRLGAWTSEVMAQRRTKINSLIECAKSGVSSQPPSTASGISRVPSITPTPASRNLSGISTWQTQATDSLPPSSSSSLTPAPPSSVPFIPQVPPSSPQISVTDKGTALMSTSTFEKVERAPSDPRSTRTDQTAVAAIDESRGAHPRNWSLIAAAMAIGISIFAVGVTALSKRSDPAKMSASDPALTVLTLSVVPTDASIFLDDAPLPPGSREVRLPRDANEHKLRVEAPGYRPAKQTIKLDDASKHISVVLAAQR